MCLFKSTLLSRYYVYIYMLSFHVKWCKIAKIIIIIYRIFIIFFQRKFALCVVYKQLLNIFIIKLNLGITESIVRFNFPFVSFKQINGHIFFLFYPRLLIHFIYFDLKGNIGTRYLYDLWFYIIARNN